jgi:hypothetical protein
MGVVDEIKVVESLVVGCIFGKTNLEAGWAT